ncbi:MAG: heavy-metal-associated domain-containing protein [Flavobacteriaceae bacterium]
MKALKLLAITLTLIITISCKKEQKETEVVTIDTTEITDTPKIAENATLAKVQFNVEGMTCAVGCAAKIEKSLNNMKGVKTAHIDFENKTAVVEYDIDQVNTDLITKQVVANGDYKAINFSTLQ